MKRSAIIILCVYALLALSGCGRGRVIPMNKFAEIYADLCVADQWINQHPDMRSQADTTQFYEAVFRKHGYRFADYQRSMDYYLDYPEKYVRIVQRADAILLEGRDKAQDKLDRQSLQQQNASPVLNGN